MRLFKSPFFQRKSPLLWRWWQEAAEEEWEEEEWESFTVKEVSEDSQASQDKGKTPHFCTLTS